MTTTHALLDRTKVEAWAPGRQGEMQLRASAPVPMGEFTIVEKPLVSVAQGVFRHRLFPWDLTDALLSDRKALETYLGWRLKSTEFLRHIEDGATERLLAKTHGVQPAMVRKLYMGVGTNNIAYFDAEGNVAGWGLFEKLSRSNHSCNPNAHLAAADPLKLEMGLIADRDIEPGEAITWNYSGNPDFLNGSYIERNYSMVNHMRFVCECPRCLAEIPPEVARQANKVRFFDDLIRTEAVKMNARDAMTLQVSRAR